MLDGRAEEEAGTYPLRRDKNQLVFVLDIFEVDVCGNQTGFGCKGERKISFRVGIA